MRALVWMSLVIAVACGGTPAPPPQEAKTAPGGSKNQSNWPADDHSMCDWRNKPELEISETAGPGAIRPNIRRVYKMIGEGENRHRALVCREIDTNLDGIKDVVRTFNAKGEALHEESDANYDGKVDHWLSFSAGSMIEEDVDTLGDGKPHEWKYYLNGALSRIKRDRKGTGKPDVWEIYNKGQLERMGVDDTGDGHVDRWERDDILRQQEEAEEAAKAAAAAGDAGTAAQTPVDRVMSVAHVGFKSCYTRSLQGNPSTAGSVVVDATPTKDGCRMSTVKVINTGGGLPASLISCLQNVIQKLDFCADKGATVTVPVHFNM